MTNTLDWTPSGTINHGGLSDKEQVGIAFLVSKGYTNGAIDGLHWKLECKSAFDDSGMEMVAELINQGYTCGHYPTWQLTFNRQSGLDHEIEKVMRNHVAKANLDLSEEQLKSALTGVLFQLNITLNEAIADVLSASK